MLHPRSSGIIQAQVAGKSSLPKAFDGFLCVFLSIAFYSGNRKQHQWKSGLAGPPHFTLKFTTQGILPCPEPKGRCFKPPNMRKKTPAEPLAFSATRPNCRFGTRIDYSTFRLFETVHRACCVDEPKHALSTPCSSHHFMENGLRGKMVFPSKSRNSGREHHHSNEFVARDSTMDGLPW